MEQGHISGLHHWQGRKPPLRRHSLRKHLQFPDKDQHPEIASTIQKKSHGVHIFTTLTYPSASYNLGPQDGHAFKGAARNEAARTPRTMPPASEAAGCWARRRCGSRGAACPRSRGGCSRTAPGRRVESSHRNPEKNPGGHGFSAK